MIDIKTNPAGRVTIGSPAGFFYSSNMKMKNVV